MNGLEYFFISYMSFHEHGHNRALCKKNFFVVIASSVQLSLYAIL